MISAIQLGAWRWFSRTCTVFLLWLSASVLGLASPDCEGYLIGAGRGDITGPIIGVGMMGYADLGQFDEGIHTRLWSRAMVVSDRCQHQTVAVVISDLAMIFNGLKQAVLSRLAQKLPGVFSDANLMLSATHTHAGPGGFAHHALYNITTLGFDPVNFNAIVDGTVDAIVRAYAQRKPASISLSKGDLKGYQFNRSPESFSQNNAAELMEFPEQADTEMLLIKVTSDDGKPMAAFNWYPVHGVSMPLTNKLVSGDNKGVASQYFERKLGATYRKENEFVAGFFQANAGDISPYDVSHGAVSGDDGFARNDWSAHGQYEKAYSLFTDPAQDEVTGPIAFAHRFEDLVYRKVSPQFTGGQREATTCNAVLGESFAAGTLNGMPFPIFKSHAIYGQNWPRITLMPTEQKCHQEKVLLLPTGFAKPQPWTARIVPFQIVRIGSLAIIGAPFEITTVAGYRLKQEIKRRLADTGVRYVALSGLSNEYIHYVTTREEYKVQAYEGGSTLYGPWSLAAYTEIFADLAEDLATGRQRPASVRPPDLSSHQLTVKFPVMVDVAPKNGEFGDVYEDAKLYYKQGDRISVTFWSAHPNNSHRQQGFSYLTVERRDGERWQPELYDWDHETTMQWSRRGLARSTATVTWFTAKDTRPGQYRLCQHGHSRSLVTRSLRPFSGCSRAFEVGSVQ